MKKKRSPRKKLAVAVYDGLLGFEFGCVAELFGLIRPGVQDVWYDYRVCRVERGELTTSHGMTLQPRYGLVELQRADIVVVPGWRSPCERPKPAFLNALQRASRRGARMISICTGAFALAHAGILDGRRATTHWLHSDHLQEQFPSVEVQGDALYIHDGPVSTSAGSSAGLDLCLSVIRGDFGIEVANMVARRMVAPMHREGGQSQYASPTVLKESEGEFGPIFDWMNARLAEPITVEQIANQFAMSLRTFQRQFSQVTGLSPLMWLSQQRIATARNLLETSDLSMEQVAVQSGLGSTANLRKHFARHLNVTPSAYRSSFSSNSGEG